MRTRQKYVDAYQVAMQEERDLWEQVKGHGPGQPGFDKALWQSWLDAVSRTNAASKAMREAFDIDEDPRA